MTIITRETSSINQSSPFTYSTSHHGNLELLFGIALSRLNIDFPSIPTKESQKAERQLNGIMLPFATIVMKYALAKDIDPGFFSKQYPNQEEVLILTNALSNLLTTDLAKSTPVTTRELANRLDSQANHILNQAFGNRDLGIKKDTDFTSMLSVVDIRTFLAPPPTDQSPDATNIGDLLALCWEDYANAKKTHKAENPAEIDEDECNYITTHALAFCQKRIAEYRHQQIDSYKKEQELIKLSKIEIAEQGRIRRQFFNFLYETNIRLPHNEEEVIQCQIASSMPDLFVVMQQFEQLAKPETIRKYTDSISHHFPIGNSSEEKERLFNEKYKEYVQDHPLPKDISPTDSLIHKYLFIIRYCYQTIPKDKSGQAKFTSIYNTIYETMDLDVDSEFSETDGQKRQQIEKLYDIRKELIVANPLRKSVEPSLLYLKLYQMGYQFLNNPELPIPTEITIPETPLSRQEFEYLRENLINSFSYFEGAPPTPPAITELEDRTNLYANISRLSHLAEAAKTLIKETLKLSKHKEQIQEKLPVIINKAVATVTGKEIGETTNSEVESITIPRGLNNEVIQEMLSIIPNNEEDGATLTTSVIKLLWLSLRYNINPNAEINNFIAEQNIIDSWTLIVTAIRRARHTQAKKHQQRHRSSEPSRKPSQPPVSFPATPDEAVLH